MSRSTLQRSLAQLQTAFGPDPTVTIRRLERELPPGPITDLELWSGALNAALEIKKLAGQVNVMVHTAGILAAVPRILEVGERIESVSLGAGNTGKEFDLSTDRRVAEFKFIQWRGGPEAIRQNQVFKDFLKLLWDTSGRRRQLFLTGITEALRFFRGGRALDSVLSRNVALRQKFHEVYAARYRTVGEFYRIVEGEVEVVDLRARLAVELQ